MDDWPTTSAVMRQAFAGHHTWDQPDDDGTDPITFAASMFPSYARAEFSTYQRALWDWAWQLAPGRRHPTRQAIVEIIFRGGAKSTTAEMVTAALGVTRRRRYALYVSGTQDQADDHVGNIGALLESTAVAARYPDHARPLVGKHGNSRGWRVNRLRTAGGFTVDAVGLDTAARGVKLEDQRPDLIVLDDIDHEHDSERIVDKKLRTLTQGLLPAGAPHVVTIAVQNLIHQDSIFARLHDGKLDMLADRTHIGPIPAIEDLEWEERDGRYLVTGGQPTWAGFTLEDAQAAIDRFGLTSFLAESQHELEPPAGGMFDHISWRRCDPEEVPWGEMERVVVWCDPAVTATDHSDSQAIQADGLTADGTIYRLRSWEARTSPVDAIERAIRWALDLGADHVGIETDQGGDTWRSVYREAVQRILATRDPDLPADVELTPAGMGEVALVRRPDGSDAGVPGFRYDKAGAGHGSKAHRASLMLADYERGRMVHVRGTHLVLERGLRRFPKVKPFDLTDAAYWSWRDLSAPAPQVRGAGRRAARARVPVGVR